MKLSLQTWNSQNINNGNPFQAYILPGQLANIQRNIVLVDRANEYPALSSVVKTGSVIVIQVLIASGQTINTQREVLKGYFFGDDLRHDLVAYDENDSNKPYYRTGIPSRLVQESDQAPNSFFITIATEYPYWQLVNAASSTWNITASGQTTSVTNGGNMSVEPIFTITPTTTKAGGLSYRRYIPIYSKLDKTVSLPLDITNGGIDTSTLVADTTTSNQVNVGGGITNSANSWAIDTPVGGGLPTGGGMFAMENEQCTYTSIAAGTISGVVRGANGTTATTHADNTVMNLSRMQADGDDLRVWLNGGFVDRWISGVNTATTKVWTNITLSAREEGTTGASMTDVATTMAFSETRANLSFLGSLKVAKNYSLLIENEIIVFDPANVDTLNYQITGLTRGEKGTTAASHASALTVRYIEHDLYIMYGDSALSAPDTDNSNKPIFDLTSTNGAWAYTNYYDSTAPNRPGSWKGELRSSRTKLSYPYTGDKNTFVDPSTKLGLAMVNSADFTVANESASLDWLFSHPAGVTDVTYSGDKYCTSSFPAIAGLQYLVPNTVWMTAENQTTPAVASAWEAFGPSSVSLGATCENIRFCLEGILSSTFSELAFIQFDTVTVTFSSGNLPTISVGVEEEINFFNIKLTNVTSTEYIKVQAPCPVDTDLTVDCSGKTAYLDDGRKVPVVLSTDRNDWLNLRVGANTLKFEDTGTVAVTLVVSHKDKNL